ncbi:Hypothetical predicted protein [Pelobates cultripes]|uniref:Uncharacterized protein n=1 Tax=Pelobates cultripes TaxID=61616 RepID=A0AAD1RN41_PELCU|nr:Hypothetical predicted protein [Pelobates cultripes]
MSKKDVTCFWIVLLLCQELRTDPIAEMGPSSGILIQETPGFILTEKRILTRRVFVSLDPKISIEKAYNISSMQLPELQTWYQMHLQRAQDRVRNILEQARKPFVSSSIPMSNRPKRFLTAIIVALVCATVGAVVATGMSAANSITVQKLDMEIYALKQHINNIHQVINQQRTLLQDVLTIVEDTVVTTNLHSELIAKSTELHQSHDLFKRELLFLHDPILFHTLAFLDEVQTGMIELAGGRIPLYFVSKDIVHAMLANVDRETIEPMQLNLAFEMGSAIPLLIDPEHSTIQDSTREVKERERETPQEPTSKAARHRKRAGLKAAAWRPTTRRHAQANGTPVSNQQKLHRIQAVIQRRPRKGTAHRNRQTTAEHKAKHRGSNRATAGDQLQPTTTPKKKAHITYRSSKPDLHNWMALPCTPGCRGRDTDHHNRTPLRSHRASADRHNPWAAAQTLRLQPLSKAFTTQSLRGQPHTLTTK